VTNHLADAWHTIVPPKDDKHGPLPPLLVLLTVVTGLVDAFSYLALGHVFVANMTGNVVFLAFALSGAPGFVAWASLLAIAAFAIGALGGGKISHVLAAHRGRITLIAVAIQFALVGAAFVVALLLPAPYGDGAIVALVILLGLGMGLQNATARALGVPDLTTTVLTLTITGITADSRLAGGKGSHAGRRILSILSMFVGALIGATFVEAGLAPWSLLIAAVLLAAVAIAGFATRHSTRAWIPSA
jgi:uncharacterized membrane protein YoaK (UPF0700 family)